MTRTATRALLALLGALALAPDAPAQVAYPPLPEKVDLQLRYRIRANRDERVRQFRELTGFLDRLGFKRARMPDDDLDIVDPGAERFTGTIPGKTVFATLDDPRVHTILFKPTDFQAPDDPARPVAVRVRIATGLFPADQQRLHRQVVAQLGRLGFREGIGYDHDRYTLVRGDLPAGNLTRLLKDLRAEPAGWFLSDTPANRLPPPIRDVLPIRSVEVLRDPELNLLAPEAVGPNRAKFAPDLRAVLDDDAARGRPVRVEVVLDGPAADRVEFFRSRLRAAYGLPRLVPGTNERVIEYPTVEGAAGNVLTARFVAAADLERFMFEPGVVFVRLPRAAVGTVVPAAGDQTPPAGALTAARLDALHRLGYRGRGTRVVVIAPEFPGLARGVGFRFLSPDLSVPVTYIDLTAELAPDLLPAPPAQNASPAGTAAARAAHLAAPGAGLVLVRVDPTAFFQLLTVARFVRGDAGTSEALLTRLTDLSLRGEELRRRNAEAADEYRRAFADPSDEPAAVRRRQEARQRFERLIAEERQLADAVARALALQEALRSLAGAEVVVNTLVWETGHPLEGLSPLSQVIETTFASEALAAPANRSATRPRVAPRPVWVQAASESAGSVWGGPFLDADANGVMEFADPKAPVPRGEWTHELNFLGTRAADGSSTDPLLPAGARVRVTVQWRETHDRNAYGGRESIFPLTLSVLHQLDPEGKTRASDELQEVRRSAGSPYPLVKEPGYGVYEQTVEFAVKDPGRYCLRVEGRPAFDPRLPALRQQTEVRPRVFVEFVGREAEKGRPVFTSFVNPNAGVGIPGDARAAVTVAAAGRNGLTGGGPGLALLRKPDLTADGTIDVGTGVGGSAAAAGFAGGAIAALIESGAPPSDVFRATGLPRGAPLQIPEGWLRVLPPPRTGPPRR